MSRFTAAHRAQTKSPPAQTFSLYIYCDQSHRGLDEDNARGDPPLVAHSALLEQLIAGVASMNAHHGLDERTCEMIQRLTLSTLSRRIATGGHAALGASLLICLTIAAPAQAQSVKFKSIHDAEPLKFFDAATTKADPSNPNRLIIGFNSGLDQTTFTTAQFVAAAARRVAMDTISFTVTAPTGFYVAKITYTQQGTGWTCRTCASAGAAEWVVAGHPASLGVFSNNPALTATADLTALKLGTVPVSITDSLFATTGSVSITAADVRVKLLPR